MKKTILFFLLLVGTSLSIIAQPDSMRSTVMDEVEQMPYFPGCDAFEDGTSEKRDCSNANIIAFISNSLVYPNSAKDEGIEGTVYVKFQVTENGMIEAAEILRDIGGGCGDEALQVVERMPKWIPAMHEGEAVAVELRLPIRFQLSEDEKASLGNKYKINWGMIRGQQLTLSDIQENLENEVIIRDSKGNALHISEMVFAYEKNNKTLFAKGRGNTINKEMEKMIKKCRTGGYFTISATVIDGTKFIEVDQTFEITE